MLSTFEATLVDAYYLSTKPQLQIFGFWWATHLHLPQSHIEVVFKSNKEGQHIHPCTVIKAVILKKNSLKPNNHFNLKNYWEWIFNVGLGPLYQKQIALIIALKLFKNFFKNLKKKIQKLL